MEVFFMHVAELNHFEWILFKRRALLWKQVRIFYVRVFYVLSHVPLISTAADLLYVARGEWVTRGGDERDAAAGGGDEQDAAVLV